MLSLPKMDNLILMLHPQSDVCCLFDQHFKSKEKVLAIKLMSFETPKEQTIKWTVVEKGSSSFQNFHLVLGKCNIVTANSFENKTLKCHARYHRDFTNQAKLNKILQQQIKEKKESSTEITEDQEQKVTLDIRMRCKSKEISALKKKSEKRKKSVLLVTIKPNKKRGLVNVKR